MVPPHVQAMVVTREGSEAYQEAVQEALDAVAETERMNRKSNGNVG